MYGAVDLLIVGKFASPADVSAVSTGSQIMMTLTNLVSSFAMGTTILLGQQIGCGERKNCGRTVGTAIVMFAVLAVAMTAVLVLLAPQISSIMNAPAEAFAKTVSYVRICGAGMPVIVAYSLIGCIFRGLGDSRTPLLTVAIACVCNIAGDLLLCAGLGLGTAGAAIATVAAQVVSVSFLIILAIVNAMGVTASAGVGVAEKVCAFIMRISSAFMQSISAFVAQNYGAGRMDRARKALHYGAADYLRAYAIDCLFTSIFFCYTGYYNGIGQTRFVMLQGIAGAFGVRVPVSYLISRTANATLFHIGLATPLSSIVQLLLCLGFMVYLKRKKPEQTVQ